MKQQTRLARVLATLFVSAALLAFSIPASAAPGGAFASGSSWSVDGLFQWFQSVLVDVGVIEAPGAESPETVHGKARVNLDPNGDLESEARVNLDPNGDLESQARVNLDPNGSD